jgi:hypothetical protein
MKLNFWQTMGLIVIVIAAVLLIVEKMSGSKPQPRRRSPPTIDAGPRAVPCNPYDNALTRVH